MSAEGLKDPHPQPRCHHPDRITAGAVCGTSKADWRTGKDACFGTIEKDRRVNLSKCAVNQLFHSTPLSNVYKGTVAVFLFIYLFLC